MPRYSVLWSPRAEKALSEMDRSMAERIYRAVDRLAGDPQHAGNVKALAGADLFRLRVGDWRVIFARQDDKELILIASLGHRREVYR